MEELKAIFVLGGGIGNMVQATPAIQAVAMSGYTVDVLLLSKNNELKELFNTDYINNVYLDEKNHIKYDVLFKGGFTSKMPEINTKKRVKSRKQLSSHNPEALYYYDMVEQIGINLKPPLPSVNLSKRNIAPKHPGSVAIFPGSKPNWSMKRWDKYDELASKFKHVVVVGKKEDVISQGDPAWIKRKWKWPANTEFFFGTLSEVAKMISNCSLYVGNDGGVTHIAAATGIPTFIVFGPSSVEKNKPHCPHAHAIALHMECRPCQYRKGEQYLRPGHATCPFNMNCMRNLTSREVYRFIHKTMRKRYDKSL